MVGLQGPRGSRVWPKGSQGVKGLTCRIPGGQGEGLRGLRGSRGKSTGSHRVIGGHGVDLEGPGGQGVNEIVNLKKKIYL